MKDPTGESPAARLLETFNVRANAGLIGGSSVLKELAGLAFACIASQDTTKDAVEFCLGHFLDSHAARRDDRPVTTDETYRFVAVAHEFISNAASFLVRDGGNSEEAVQIIADFATFRC